MSDNGYIIIPRREFDRLIDAYDAHSQALSDVVDALGYASGSPFATAGPEPEQTESAAPEPVNGESELAPDCDAVDAVREAIASIRDDITDAMREVGAQHATVEIVERPGGFDLTWQITKEE